MLWRQMDDVGGNVEEHIGSMEEQIGVVEKHIQGREELIYDDGEQKQLQ